MKDLISTGTRGLFRNLMTDSTVNTISSAFHDEGFAANPDCQYGDTSVRRVTAQEHLESVNWTDPGHVDRACRVFEQLLIGWSDSPYLERFYASLRRDGCTVDYPGTGLITPPADRGSMRPLQSLATLTDPSAIQEQLDRIQRAIIDDPALAIGSAKELVESTAKVVLIERGRPVNDKDDLPALAKAAQEALGLHPSSTTPGPDGSDAVKKILGAVSTIATGLGELRNRGYGTGHGAAAARRARPPARTPRRQRRRHLVPNPSRHPRRSRSALAQEPVINTVSARFSASTTATPSERRTRRRSSWPAPTSPPWMRPPDRISAGQAISARNFPSHPERLDTFTRQLPPQTADPSNATTDREYLTADWVKRSTVSIVSVMSPLRPITLRLSTAFSDPQ